MQIAGLDVGTQSIKLIVAEIGKEGKIKILKVYKTPTYGVRRGAIFDMDDAVAASSDLFATLRQNFKAASRNIFVGVNGPQISAHTSKGIIAVSRADSEIYRDDIDRVLKASQAIGLAPNRKIIHTITKEFTVDGVRDIPDPTGLVGNRLEVESVIIDAFSPYIQNLTRLVEINGGKVSGFIMNTLASSKAVLTKKQKELGVALVEIGAGTSGLAVYEENKLIHAAVFPIGAGHITNDVAVGFKIPVGDAESVKLQFGYAVSREVPAKESVELKLVNASLKNAVPKRFLSEIIESRLAEIFGFVERELKHIGKAGNLPGGVVLTGGGAKLPGILHLAKEELRLAPQIGLTEADFQILDAEYKTELEDPEFVTALGLALWGAEFSGRGHTAFQMPLSGNQLVAFIRAFIKNLLP